MAAPTASPSPSPSAGGGAAVGAADAPIAARYQAVLDSTLDPVVTIDGYGVIQSVSRSVERVFGYAPGELVGQNVSILMPEPHRSDHDAYLENYRRTGETSILGRTREFQARRRDGTLFPIELAVARVDVPGEHLPLFTGIIRDISEQRRAERELRLTQQLAVAISAAPDLASALSAAMGRICEAMAWDYAEAWLPSEAGPLAPAAEWHRDAGASPEDRPLDVNAQAGPSLYERVWNSRRPEWFEDLTRAAPGAFRRGTAAAKARMQSALAVPVASANEAAAVLVFFCRKHIEDPRRAAELVAPALATLVPVIRRRRLEAELARHRDHLELLMRERTRQLEATHAQLRIADRLASIGTLAAGLGHDMNNVLLPIRCRLDALDATDLAPDVREQFHAVRRSVAYLQQLSDGLHLLALDPEDPEASTEFTDLSLWWENVGVLLRRGVPRHASFVAEIAAGLRPVGVAPHRLTQAMLNLVVNAGEAVGHGGEVRLWARAESGERIVIGVTDDGHGMDEDVLRRAMDPFYTTKKRGLGTGLGLPLVRSVAQAAGGDVRITSSPGSGTTVTLSLPAVHRDAEDGGAGVCATVTIADERLATMVSALLVAAGVRVRRAAPGSAPEGSIWVGDAGEDAAPAARRFLRAAPRNRAVLVGPGAGATGVPGVIGVERDDEFEAIRAAMGAAVRGVGGPPPGCEP